MTGRVDQRPVLVEGLPKAGKERHVLAGRPDGPVANPDQQLGRRVDKPIKKSRQPDLSPRVCRQGKLDTLEFESLYVRLWPDDVAFTLTSGIGAPRAPVGRFAYVRNRMVRVSKDGLTLCHSAASGAHDRIKSHHPDAADAARRLQRLLVSSDQGQRGSVPCVAIKELPERLKLLTSAINEDRRSIAVGHEPKTPRVDEKVGERHPATVGSHHGVALSNDPVD